MTASEPVSLGHLNPGADGVAFDRFELGSGVGDLVRHVWVVRWSVPEGESRPQRTLSYPAFNAILQPAGGSEASGTLGGAALAGPDPKLSVVSLRGRSWAVGVLFRPAAGPLLLGGTDPRSLAGREMPLPGAPESAVEAAMTRLPSGDVARRALVGALRGWLAPIAARVDDRGRLMNEVGRLAETDPEILRAAELADRAGLGVRSLERLVREHVGVSPKWLIECRRLQAASTALYAHPETDLSGLAAALGYADYPHFSRRYARFLGETPDETRRNGSLQRA
ncbi:helix-turn-helix domain-containing protein [Herbiconiux sp.]|uniref:AraC family transcriptional regulator n=1 Tax=Herbiconiux sp. TaxID=1871186 RepID=UPI0025C0DB0D|nr:helix-turn-helix domain-containing protein [Herbiconiux sp.]